MEVQYKTVISIDDWYKKDYYCFVSLFPDRKYPKKMDACCIKMKEHWCDDLVVLQEVSHETDVPDVELCWTIPDYDGATSQSSEIDYCPWCGEEITLKEVQRVRKIRKTKQVTETKTITEYEEVEEKG